MGVSCSLDVHVELKSRKPSTIMSDLCCGFQRDQICYALGWRSRCWEPFLQSELTLLMPWKMLGHLGGIGGPPFTILSQVLLASYTAVPCRESVLLSRWFQCSIDTKSRAQSAPNLVFLSEGKFEGSQIPWGGECLCRGRDSRSNQQ